METINDSLKFVSQARALVQQCLNNEPAEHETLLISILCLLDKTVEILASSDK